jgi:eukaryotic-like serine/threonine-protein kinase
VYRAEHLVLDRAYAVKVLYRRSAANPGLVARLKREARALSRIDHPNVVKVFDFGHTSDGRPFLTMELLKGRTLANRLLTEGAFPRSELIRLTLGLVSGLAETHRQGVVHRDLKPANVMLVNQDGIEIPKLLDFGIVRMLENSPRERGLTGHEVILGTPRYMAPEQVVAPAQVGVTSDLYALGVMLYELVSGHAPFQGTMVQVIEQHLRREPEPLATDTGLEPLIHQLLQKDPARRPTSADEVLRVVEALMDAEWCDFTGVDAPFTALEDVTQGDAGDQREDTVPEVASWPPDQTEDPAELTVSESRSRRVFQALGSLKQMRGAWFAVALLAGLGTISFVL